MEPIRKMKQTLKRKLSADTRRKLHAFRSPASLKREVRRWRAHRAADAFLISFPKCGRTWLRLLIGCAIAQFFGLGDIPDLELTPLGDRSRGIPTVQVTHDDLQRPLATPEDLNPSKEKYRDKKVALLVRDPLDVVVSYYFHQKKRLKSYDGELSDFLYERKGGFDTILRFYNLWATNWHVPRDFLLVRYEDLHQDPCLELRQVLDFLGLEAVDDQTIADAVAYASFDNMRRMELGNELRSDRLKAFDPGDPESYKTRKGKVGGFVEYLTDDEIRYLTAKMNRKLSPFYGYTTRTEPAVCRPETYTT